jgi:hypothetical protein
MRQKIRKVYFIVLPVVLTVILSVSSAGIAKADEDCGLTDVTCKIGQVISSWWDNLWKGVATAIGKLVAGMFTFWMSIPTTGVLNMQTQGGDAYNPLDETVTLGGLTISFHTILNWLTWFTAIAATAMLIIYFTKLSAARQSGSAFDISKSLLWIGLGLLMATGAGGLVSVLMKKEIAVTNTASWITSQLYPIMLISLVIAVIVTGIKVITEQKGQPIKELLTSILTVLLVTNVGGVVMLLFCNATDKLSSHIIQVAISCESTNSGCFGEAIASYFATSLGGGETSWMIILTFCLFGIITSLIQTFIMLGRSIMLVLVLGMLAFWATMRYTKMGKEAFDKCIAWLVALVLYKPAAAIIYALGFKIAASTDLFFGLTQDSTTAGDNSVVGLLYFLISTILAIFALPALIKLIAPATAAVAGSGGAGMSLMGVAATGMMANPQGASEMMAKIGNKAPMAGKAVATGGASLAADIPKQAAKQTAGAAMNAASSAGASAGGGASTSGGLASAGAASSTGTGAGAGGKATSGGASSAGSSGGTSSTGVAGGASTGGVAGGATLAQASSPAATGATGSGGASSGASNVSSGAGGVAKGANIASPVVNTMSSLAKEAVGEDSSNATGATGNQGASGATGSKATQGATLNTTTGNEASAKSGASVPTTAQTTSSTPTGSTTKTASPNLRGVLRDPNTGKIMG